MATFMAKWSRDWPGQCGHIHCSLKGKGGKPVFHDAKEPHGMSDIMRFRRRTAGADAANLLAMVAWTVNSYTRLIPGFLGADRCDLGRREPNLRASGHNGLGQVAARRVSDRCRRHQPLYRARRAIGSGLWGIEHRIEPDKPIEGNAYEKKHAAKRQLPRTLWESAQRLKISRRGARAVRRRIRRPLCRDPGMGGARIPQARSPTGRWSAILRSSNRDKREPRCVRALRSPP